MWLSRLGHTPQLEREMQRGLCLSFCLSQLRTQWDEGALQLTNSQLRRLCVSVESVKLQLAMDEAGPRHSGKGSVLLKRGETDLSIDTSGLQRFLPKFLRFAFADAEAEKAYRIAYESEKRRDFTILITIVSIVNVFLLGLLGFHDYISRLGDHLYLLITLSITLIATRLAGRVCSDASAGPRTWFVLPIIMWLIEATHIICDLWFYPVPRLAADSVSWILLYTYTIYVIFPMRFRYCCLLALLLNLLHLLLLVTSTTHQELFPNQVLLWLSHLSSCAQWTSQSLVQQVKLINLPLSLSLCFFSFMYSF